jgi:DnaK suppressor protein
MAESGRKLSGPARKAAKPASTPAATPVTKGSTTATPSAATAPPAKKAAPTPMPAQKPEPPQKVPTKRPAAKKTTGQKPSATALAPGALKVRPGETPWTDAELHEVREELEADVTRLREEIAAAESELADLLRDPGDGAGDDQADAGTKAFEREHEMSLANNSRDLLVQVERALARLDAGTYGRCENCGNPIPKARLQAFPRATLCVACKQREERR